MSGLLNKLARGLGAGLQTYGKGTADRQREERLAKIRAEEKAADKAFQTSERQARNDSSVAAADTLNTNRMAAAELATTNSTTAAATTAAAKVEAEKVKATAAKLKGDEDRKGLLERAEITSGNKVFKPTIKKSENEQGEIISEWTTEDGNIVQRNDTTATVTTLDINGRVISVEEDVEHSTPPSFIKEGKEWADKQTSYSSFDSTEFDMLPEEFRSEHQVAGLYEKLMQRAHKEGKSEQVKKILDGKDGLNFLNTKIRTLLNYK